MYCSQPDLVTRFGESEIVDLTDVEGTGAIDSTKVTQAISDAGALIDGYLAGRYQLPLATVPTVLNRLAADIARYFLYDNGANEQVQKRYDDAEKFLKAVSKGDISLGVDSAGDKAETHDCAELVTDGHVFSRRDKGFM